MNLKNLSAKSIAKKIMDKEISSKETVQYFIDRIEEINPSLNAVVVKRYKEALSEAENIDKQIAVGNGIGKLQGLPFTIKECLDLEGTPSTFGVPHRINDIPDHTDPYISKLLDEGGIVLGKTNVAQLLLYYESNNPVYGVTNNPYNPLFSSGGSSGGEAAIISAGGSPVGIGTDIGGSVRIPAAFCGIKSIKPTSWRTTDHSRFVKPMRHSPIPSVTGVLGNYTDDLEMMLEIMNAQAMHERKDVRPLGKMNEVEVDKLKVGYFLSDGLFETMPAVKRAILETVTKLKSQGVNVIEWRPPLLSKAEELFFNVMSMDHSYLFTENLGKDKPTMQAAGVIMLSKASPLLVSMLAFFTKLFGQKYLHRIISYSGGKGDAFRKKLEMELENYRQTFIQQMNNTDIGELDAIISPVCALPGYLHNTADKLVVGGTYASMYNVLGFPAGVMNVTKVKPEEAVGRKTTSDASSKEVAKAESKSAGLPLPVQIAAKPWREDIVLALMKSLEK